MADGSDHPPDPGAARSLDDLIASLRSLKVWAGDPSFETITRRINARWAADGRPENELARRGTVVDCFRSGRRRINAELLVAVVQALHDEAGYVAHWRQAVRVSLAEAYAAGQVRVLNRLPTDLATFTGRESQLDDLRRTGGGVFVLTGMAGVGKTQLAVRAAHTLGSHDVTLFVNLRGFHPDEGQPPAEPAAVLDGFLRLLGVPAQQIPHAIEARSAMFGDRLAGRTAVIILDNAVDESQVRPLLVTAPGVRTLITSRRSLAGLDARRIDVDVLTPDEAAGLLARAVPGVPVGTDPEAQERVAHRCGHLPLALTMVAAQMAGTPGWTITDHADRLDERHQHHRLDDGVHLALHVSYQRLPADRQTLLRRLAAHPGQDLDVHAAAALLDTDPAGTAVHLNHLVADHLVQQPVGERFVLHDLVRAYAAERAADEDRPADRRAALTRLFDHYLYAAAAAMDALQPAEKHRRPVLPPRPLSLDLSDPKTALLWLDAERATLVAVCLHAARHGSPEHAVRLAATLYSYLDNGGYPADAIAVHSEARRAARSISDRAGEAGALGHLGVVHWQLGRYPVAIDQLSRALALFREIGDTRGEARSLGNLGIVLAATGDLEGSADYHEQALSRFIAIEDRVGEPNTLCNLGDTYAQLGRFEQAAAYNGKALALFRELEHRGGEATALTNLGEVHLRRGAFAAAVADLEQAVAIFREIGERYGEVCALNSQGQALTGLGRTAEAAASHQAALELAEEIDEPGEQSRARAALDLLTAGEPRTLDS
jgi:tetratricopeptide (TPR) repeat protein